MDIFLNFYALLVKLLSTRCLRALAAGSYSTGVVPQIFKFLNEIFTIEGIVLFLEFSFVVPPAFYRAAQVCYGTSRLNLCLRGNEL